MPTETFKKPLSAYFHFGVWNANDMVLEYEMSSLRRKDEGKYYWFAASFVCDKIQQCSNAVTLYYIRRKGMKRKNAILLQSNWPGVEYLEIANKKVGRCDL